MKTTLHRFNELHCGLWAVTSICLLLLFCAPAPSQEKNAPPASPQLLEKAPASGTFYLLGRIPSPPFPFDPYYGALPVFAYDGVFFVDDSTVSLFEMSFVSGGEGGGTMLMSSLAPPCDPCPTNEFSGSGGATYLGGWTTDRKSVV